MARGKKKSLNNANNTDERSNNANVDQITQGIKNLTVKEKGQKKTQNASEKLTPYQGRRQCFGLYECPDCENEWASSHSWANTWQQCFECRFKVYPHRQWPKKKKRGIKEGDKPHQRQHCGKCIHLGRYCGNRV